MWGTKMETKPVVIGDQGLIKKKLHTENTQKKSLGQSTSWATKKLVY